MVPAYYYTKQAGRGLVIDWDTLAYEFPRRNAGSLARHYNGPSPSHLEARPGSTLQTLLLDLVSQLERPQAHLRKLTREVEVGSH
jgi:hypothetical protein